MSDPAAFLASRLDEAEERAEATTSMPWFANAERDQVMCCRFEEDPDCDHEYCQIADGFALNNSTLRANVLHIVAWDPQTVLRLVAAHRKLLELHASEQDCPSSAETYRTYVVGGEPCETVKLLAQGWGWTP